MHDRFHHIHFIITSTNGSHTWNDFFASILLRRNWAHQSANKRLRLVLLKDSNQSSHPSPSAITKADRPTTHTEQLVNLTHKTTSGTWPGRLRPRLTSCCWTLTSCRVRVHQTCFRISSRKPRDSVRR